MFVGRQYWQLWYAEMYMYLNLNLTTDAFFFSILYTPFIYSRRLYNILQFLWLYNEFFIILYNILKKLLS